jgi:hypothetical protein
MEQLYRRLLYPKYREAGFGSASIRLAEAFSLCGCCPHLSNQRQVLRILYLRAWLSMKELLYEIDGKEGAC